MPSPQKSFQEVLQELWALLRDYAKQETVAPLKNLGRQLGYGLAGSFVVALGVFLLGLSLLRGLQDHVAFFEAHQYLQYLVVVLFYAACIGLVLRRLLPPAADDPPTGADTATASATSTPTPTTTLPGTTPTTSDEGSST